MEWAGFPMLAAVALGLIATGLPAFIVLIGVALLFALLGIALGAVPLSLLTALPLRLFGLLENDLLQALPLYVLMGALLNRLPLAESLFRAGNALFARSAAAPLLAALGLGALLAPMNGSVGASAANLSRVVEPRLLASGVPAPQALTLVSVASTLGVVVPPSLVLILLGDSMLRAHTEAINASHLAQRVINTQDVFQGALPPALLFLGLAIAGLRPLRGSSWPGARPQTGWWTRLSGVAQGLARTRAATSIAQNPLLVTQSARPPCGDAPMLWKERYARMTGSLSWLSSRGVILFFSVFLGCFLFDVAYPALSELFGTSHSHGTQTAMNSALRQASVALSVLGMLAIAASSAVSLTGEREQDTWISLATTLLSPGEIIWAKQVGAVWSAWRIGLALLVVWATGILLGALHPTGVLVSATIVGLVAWFVAAVGVFVSGRVRNSTRSLAWTFLILILGLGNWPWMVGGSLGTYREVATPWSNQKLGVGNPWSEPANALIVWAVELALYAAAAGLLTWGSIRRLRATWGES